jgi:Zn-dependent peptidase ImmA (M78 family)
VFVDGKPLKFRSAAERAVDSWVNKHTGPRGLSTDEDWREWQANVFSSALLMPEWAVEAEFRQRLGSEAMVVDRCANSRDAALQVASQEVFESDVYDQSLAELFGVSRQAMAIRLLELGLVKEGEG